MRAISALIFSVIALTAWPALAGTEMRLLSGEIMVVERMALPEDTVVIVDLTNSSASGVATQRRTSEGQQSPFAFEIEAPQAQDLVLRVGLRAGEDKLWLSEPALIAAGDEDLALGTIRALRLPLIGPTVLLSCGNTLVEIGMLPETLRMRLNEQLLSLTGQEAASGALYVDPNNQATSVHLKQDRAVVRIDGAELSECTILQPEAELTKEVWTISAIEDRPTVFPSRTELAFFPDGRISASVGCNRLIGSYSRHGGILTLGRIASTMMACPEGLDAQEAQFSAVLPRIDGYVMDPEAGRLVLTSGGTPVLRARR